MLGSVSHIGLKSMPLTRHDAHVADARATSRVVAIVVFDGVKLLDAAGPAEVFAEANRFGAHYIA